MRSVFEGNPRNKSVVLDRRHAKRSCVLCADKNVGRFDLAVLARQPQSHFDAHRRGAAESAIPSLNETASEHHGMGTVSTGYLHGANKMKRFIVAIQPKPCPMGPNMCPERSTVRNCGKSSFVAEQEVKAMQQIRVTYHL